MTGRLAACRRRVLDPTRPSIRERQFPDGRQGSTSLTDTATFQRFTAMGVVDTNNQLKSLILAQIERWRHG
jgi:hypothetical protein